MAVRHTLTRNLVADGRSLSFSKTYTAEAGQVIDVNVPDSTTDMEVALVLDVSEITNLVLASDQDVTIETNNATTPDDTISLAANAPIIWNADQPYSCPLTVDTTKLFLTNASGSTARVQVEVLADPTP